MKIITGDVRTILPSLPAQTFNCCVTSPPYFGLRDYGVDGQIGLEQTPQAYVNELVAVFREVRRVLCDDGTLWLNLGDSYWTAKGASMGADPKQGARRGWARPQDRPAPAGLKGKDLIGIPWRVAFALQADGWYLRQDIIWHKPNPMPESVRDRCTKAHEYVFLLSKSSTYYFDSAAIKEPATYQVAATKKSSGTYSEGTGTRNDVGGHKSGGFVTGETRNKRSVWTVTPQPYKEAHFATFPPALVEPCILAGSPSGGHVLDPFGGAGTTGLVAEQHGRDSTLIELNPQYAELAFKRVYGEWL